MNFSMQAKCSDAKVTMSDDTKTMTQEALDHPSPQPCQCYCCCPICRQLDVIRNQHLAEISASLAKIAICVCKKAVDMGIFFEPPVKGSEEMAKKSTGPAVKCPCLAPKSGGKKAVMTDVTLTSPLPSAIQLQALDAATPPNVVPIGPGDSVTTTLVSDHPEFFTIAPGADNLNWVGTIPPNTPQGSVANLAATMVGTIQGAPADLSASVKVTINVPPSPVAVDLAIVFG